jgi:hypothetical protein
VEGIENTCWGSRNRLDRKKSQVPSRPEFPATLRLEATACAAFIEESRRKFAKATNADGESAGSAVPQTLRENVALRVSLLGKLHIIEKLVVIETRRRREEANHFHLLAPGIPQHMYFPLRKQNRAPRFYRFHHSLDHHFA